MTILFQKNTYSPVPDILWLLRNGSVINPNSKYQIKENERQLFIRNVTFDDEGVYTCVAKNNLTMKPYLNVTSKYCGLHVFEFKIIKGRLFFLWEIPW